MWIEAVVNNQWSHKVLPTITTSSSTTMTSIATGAYTAMSQTAFLYALPTCEGIGHKIYLISIIIKRLRECKVNKRPKHAKQNFEK